MLIGSFYSRFAVGDSFDFRFEGFILSARDLVSEEEALVSAVLLDTYEPARQTAISEYLAKSVIAATCLGVPIAAVDLSSDSTLLLTFRNGVMVRLPTSTPIVDWHWAITEEGGDPYVESLIVCFAPGDIQGDTVAS